MIFRNIASFRLLICCMKYYREITNQNHRVVYTASILTIRKKGSGKSHAEPK
jgi:hypothetical protein